MKPSLSQNPYTSTSSTSISSASTPCPPAAQARTASAAQAALGKLTKYADTNRVETVDQDTGEVLCFQRVSANGGPEIFTPKYDQDAVDLERWMLKHHARRLLMIFEERTKTKKYTFVDDFGTLRTKYAPPATVHSYDYAGQEYEYKFDAKKNAPVYRVINCSRSKIGMAVQPEIWHSIETDRCSFHNVVLCGSVWTCPTCSRKINLSRQAQIKGCYEAFKAQPAADTLMITFTIKHGITDLLTDLFDLLKTADRKHLQKSYGYKKLVGYKRTLKGASVAVASAYGYAGRISTTEITHGKSGWHPHSHQLWFFDKKLSAKEIEEIRKLLFKAWKAACKAVGLPAPIEFHTDPLTGKKKAIGVDVRRALTADEYMAKFGTGAVRKWAPEKEMASSHVKTAKHGGRSAFEILADAADGCKDSAALFRVYADATLGRHQLEFSTGLKKRLRTLAPDVFDEVELSDDVLAAQEGSDSNLIGTLTDADYTALCKHKGPVEPFGTCLYLAKTQGFDAAVKWIRSLPTYVVTVAYATDSSRTAEIADHYLATVPVRLAAANARIAHYDREYAKRSTSAIWTRPTESYGLHSGDKDDEEYRF